MSEHDQEHDQEQPGHAADDQEQPGHAADEREQLAGRRRFPAGGATR